jgi:succinoglycan biosynthesis protein ExoA
VRIDAHAEYAPDYVSQCVACLESTGADNVGGPMVAAGRPGLQAVIAASYDSPFALGGGRFHDPRYEGDVDTVYLGAFRKSSLVRVGLFDERFTRNQDDELNYRIVRSGGRIFMTPRIRSTYHPRDSLRALFSQYAQYGEWKVLVIAKHRKPARITHLVPGAFVLWLCTAVPVSFAWPPARVPVLVVLLAYIGLAILFSMRNRHVSRVGDRLLLVLVHVVLHVSYGLGFLKGLVRAARGRDRFLHGPASPGVSPAREEPRSVRS